MTPISSRAPTATALSVALVLCCGILTGCGQWGGAGSGVSTSVTQADTANDLHALDESMLIGEGSVPPLGGTSWGTMVAVPRGHEPEVSPAGCELFLSQGAAVQKGLAMRSSKNASIGVTLTLPVGRADLPTLAERCRTFTYTAPGAKSQVVLGPFAVEGLPTGTISTIMHCRTVRIDQTLEWDIAAILGFHRGVLVTAQYTAGPQGGAFDPEFASRLGEVYLAQIAKLG